MKMEESKYKGYDGTEMLLRIWKPDGEPKAVFLAIHGLGTHSGLIAPVCEYFADKGMLVYAPDMRGFGTYPGIKGHVENFDEYIKDMMNLIEQIRSEKADKKLFLWGHSLGGLHVIRYISKHPENLSGAIIVCPGISERLKVGRVTRALSRLLSKLNVKKKFYDGINLELISRNPEVVKRNREDPLRYDYVTPRFAAEGFQASAEGAQLGPEIHIPVLVQQSGNDLIVIPEKTKEFFESIASEDKTWRFYEGLYHEPFEELGGEAVLQDAVEWIENHL